MIHIHLSTHPRTGTITIHGERFDLATWHRAGEPPRRRAAKIVPAKPTRTQIARGNRLALALARSG